MAYERDGVEQINVEELKEVLNDASDSSIVIDVREPSEYEEGHIPGIPLLPMRQIPELIEDIDKDKSYIFVCRSGNRSHHTALYFKDHGIENVKNFAGGMLAWDSEVATGLEKVIKEAKDLYESK